MLTASASEFSHGGTESLVLEKLKMSVFDHDYLGARKSLSFTPIDWQNMPDKLAFLR